MIRTLLCITALSGLLLTTGIAADTESAPAPKRFSVELIVFRHLDQGRNTPEIPAASSIFRRSPLDLSIAEAPNAPPIPDTSLETLDVADNVEPVSSIYPDFAPLRDDARALNDLYARLARVDAYQPIVRVGWIQTVHSADDAMPYRFEPVTIGDDHVAGTVTLYKGRFLHLELDLALTAEKPAVETRFGFGFGADRSEVQEPYKLTESRRIRGSATHYFDHPQFGVIARIAPVETSLAAGGTPPPAVQQ